MKEKPQKNTALLVANFLKNLSNPHRLKVIGRLYEREWCVSELEEETGLKQSALSQHLARLRREKLVQTRREGQTIYYRLSDDRLKKLMKSIYHIFPKPEKRR